MVWHAQENVGGAAMPREAVQAVRGVGAAGCCSSGAGLQQQLDCARFDARFALPRARSMRSNVVHERWHG